MDDEVEEALEKINEDCYPELIVLACELLASSKRDGRSPTNVLYDLVEATSFPKVKERMYKDYDCK